MENQENKSSWDDLARKLGAEIRPDEPPPAPQESYSDRPPADKSRAPLPKRQAADWSQLNVNLGLPPVEEPPAATEGHATEPPPRRSEPSVPREVPTRSESAGDEGRSRSRRRDETRPRQDDRGERAREDRGRARTRRDDRESERSEQQSDSRPPGRGRRGRGGRGGGGSRDRDPQREHDRPAARDGGQRSQRDRRDHGARPQRKDEPTSNWRESEPTVFEEAEIEEREISMESRADERAAPAPDTAAAPAPPPPPKQSAGISLWHKIFGSPAEQAAKLTEQVEETEQVEIAESISESIPERESSWPAVDYQLPPDRPQESELTDDASPGMEFRDEPGELDEGEARQRGRSRRRRGRGGRGSRGREQQPSTRRERGASGRVERSGHDDDFDDLGVEDDDVAGDEIARGGDEVESDAFDDGDSDELSGRGADGRGHRSIPSWDEAIGLIVDSNLQSRPQRRQSSQSGRRGGSSRGGRSRGGRRHSNPQNGN